MSKLNSSTRLKVNRDTFFLPDSKGGVYFRNNSSSFRMEGNTIYQWIEKLIPMFDGEKTLGELTEGLTTPYRNRVYEIGETLYKNGFLRDVSKDTPHQLNSSVLEKYASQIEFIENFVESGGYRFQKYRQAKVLAVGSGPLLVALVSALLESGLPKINVLVTDSIPTSRMRLNELVQNASKTDSDVELAEVQFQKEAGRSFWKEAVQPYDWIMYVSQDGNVNELRELNLICKEERKAFIPAICLQQVGLSGPLLHPESEGCWESAWRRIHRSALHIEQRSQPFSSTTGSILANVAVFEMFKNAVGIADPNQSNQIYLLDLDTLEGDWLSFITHPLVTSRSFTPNLVKDLDVRLKQESLRDNSPSNLLEHFSQLTSEKTGIFHTWEERNLSQLPLAQCSVQVVNPMSEGPAELLSEVVCAGLTHEEAKRDAGLTGIEMYVSQMIDPLELKKQNDQVSVNITEEFLGIGAGETIEEAVCRGLQVYLNEELRKRKSDQRNTIFHMQIGSIKDKSCRFYLNALTTLNGSPIIGLSEDISGFPVIDVRSNGRWYSSVGLNTTLAMRNALQQALLDSQSQENSIKRQEMESAVFLKRKENNLDIPSLDELPQCELLQTSIQVLNQNNKRLLVYDLTFEPFLKQEMAGVFGVQVREGEF
ncbi:MAG TPA: putative thiazole-containing bacteriocin maturation protein [Bacillus bacterium]|uniref:Thiazole-containing bacteriocin maturation protein n=1 Tax=Siminovitchia fordii TaxID=254759 RepID=A0ABQ4KAM3_9BACI|nr:putative thiazole-containing bacteriocin maturation protein [Siminovitchia fordii]GIN22777.1 putative thiazole-containing bacteriocin maturation protein [Siminovitchia fordii]HBZ09906.1 putative thiazole-containing bacteriocin maturation protein [Bacillus sp. (in: firmicutes)]